MQGSRVITLVLLAQEDVDGLYDVTVFALHWDGGGEAASAVAGDDGEPGEGDGWGEAGGGFLRADGDGASLLPRRDPASFSSQEEELMLVQLGEVRVMV